MLTDYFSCLKLNWEQIHPFHYQKNSQKLKDCQTIDVIKVLGYSNIDVKKVTFEIFFTQVCIPQKS